MDCEKNKALFLNNDTSQDRKILNWNGRDYEAFVSSFTEDELEEMNSYLVHHPYFPLDCEYDEEGRAGSIVCDYIRRWLYQLLEDGIISGARELFEIVEVIA